MTRDEILGLKVGDIIQTTYDTVNGKVLPTARYCNPHQVVEIFAQEVSKYHGMAYVCGYHEFGPNARMSFSCLEGEDYVRIVKL